MVLAPSLEVASKTPQKDAADTADISPPGVRLSG